MFAWVLISTTAGYTLADDTLPRDWSVDFPVLLTDSSKG